MAVTIGLRISDGTTTKTLSNGTTGWLIEYSPVTKTETVDTVNESATAVLLSTLSTVRSTVEDINRLFRQARIYQAERSGACVYVERQLDTSEDWWRSEIIDGMCQLNERSLDGELAQGKVEVVIAYVRRNYWEGAESQISLTNGNGTDNTTGLTVYNHDDATSGHDNWVTITAAKVSGDLPAPVRIQMTNTDSGTNKTIDYLWIGHNWTDTTMTHMLEAESAAGGSLIADGDCSGGSYRSISLASGAETNLLTWTLDATALAALAGRWYRPLVVFRTDTSGAGRIADTAGTAEAIQYRVKLLDLAGARTIWQGSRVYKTGELNPVRIPAQLIGQTGLYSIKLAITGYQTSGSSKTVDIDFVELQPLDGWRKVVMFDGYVSNTYRLIDDGFTGITYGDSGAGSGKWPARGVYGSPIMLQPNKLQRLYFLWQSIYYAGAGRHFNSSTATLKLYYRPRRLTLN